MSRARARAYVAAAASDAAHHATDETIQAQNQEVYEYLVPVVKGFSTEMLGGSYVTTGLLIGFFEFIFFWLLTAVYVRRANSEFDALTAEILRESLKGQK